MTTITATPIQAIPCPARPAWKENMMIVSAVIAVSAFAMDMFSMGALLSTKSNSEALFIAILISFGTSILFWLIAALMMCAAGDRRIWTTPTKIIASLVAATAVIGVVGFVLVITRDYFPDATDEEKKTEANGLARGINGTLVVIYNSLVLPYAGASLACAAPCRRTAEAIELPEVTDVQNDVSEKTELL